MPNSDNSIPAEAHKLLGQYLTLTESALKRYSVDRYNSQLTIARNYMWLSFITISGYVALFDAFGLGQMLRNYVIDEQGSLFYLLTPLFLIKAMWISIEVLLHAIKASTGTTFQETFETVNDKFETLESYDFEPQDFYEIPRDTLKSLNNNLIDAMDQANRRGTLLRSMANEISHSIYWAIASIILYTLTFL